MAFQLIQGEVAQESGKLDGSKGYRGVAVESHQGAVSYMAGTAHVHPETLSFAGRDALKPDACPDPTTVHMSLCY